MTVAIGVWKIAHHRGQRSCVSSTEKSAIGGAPAATNNGYNAQQRKNRTKATMGFIVSKLTDPRETHLLCLIEALAFLAVHRLWCLSYLMFAADASSCV